MDLLDTSGLLRLVLALAFVLCLIGLVAMLVRRYGGKLMAAGPGARLAVLEWRQLDPRHRLVLVRRDNREHLLLLTVGGSPLLIESGLERVETPAPLVGPAR